MTSSPSRPDHTSPSALPRHRWWRSALTRHFGDAAPRLLGRIEATYSDLIADRPGFATDRAVLAWHLRMSIGPMPAAYLVIRDEIGDRIAALGDAERLMIEQLAPVLTVYGWLDRLHLPFTVVRAANRLLVPAGFPAPGFDIHWQKNSADELAFAVHRCFYLRVLMHYGKPELTGIFCRGDEIVYEKMARTVAFHRVGTLARGASCCDFTFRPQ